MQLLAESCLRVKFIHIGVEKNLRNVTENICSSLIGVDLLITVPIRQCDRYTKDWGLSQNKNQTSSLIIFSNNLCNGCGTTFFNSISLLAALFFSALSVLAVVWERETGNVAILSPPSTSTVATLTSPPLEICPAHAGFSDSQRYCISFVQRRSIERNILVGIFKVFREYIFNCSNTIIEHLIYTKRKIAVSSGYFVMKEKMLYSSNAVVDAKATVILYNLTKTRSKPILFVPNITKYFSLFVVASLFYLLISAALCPRMVNK
ncbi:hypothetical protein FF38_00208 [Lucilia cuprina]|uniref:Uncharacterized protein n=1 Tax=Lucilia cuprina TaxID=7375 RepID=A0A0L0BRD2_LUCCU|nr:hypothetical protein FF38_00208 [Lucilia cuprina]